MAAGAEAKGELDRKDLETALEFLREFADDYHQGREESVFFPALLSAGIPAPWTSVKAMIFEHNQERSLVEGIEDSLKTANSKDFAALAHRLFEILATHIYKEEHILFDIAREILTEQDDERVSRALEKIDSGGGLCSTKFAANIRELEWKYLRRRVAG
jgi:hemerythrin-like domain-containing protein